MPSKEKAALDSLLDNDGPPPVLRRGRGVELSPVLPAPTSAPVAPPLAIPVPPPPAVRLSPSDNATVVPSHDRIAAQSHDRTDVPEVPEVKNDASRLNVPRRVNRGYKLREDLIKALKRVALDEDRKLFEVMEEALETYLSARRS